MPRKKATANLPRTDDTGAGDKDPVTPTKRRSTQPMPIPPSPYTIQRDQLSGRRAQPPEGNESSFHRANSRMRSVPWLLSGGVLGLLDAGTAAGIDGDRGSSYHHHHERMVRRAQQGKEQQQGCLQAHGQRHMILDSRRETDPHRQMGSRHPCQMVTEGLVLLFEDARQYHESLFEFDLLEDSPTPI